jgi:hypothetical protein
MRRYALINKLTNIISNIIVYDGMTTYIPPNGTFMIDITDIFVNIGWIYDDSLNQFIPPPSFEVE